MPRAKLVCRNVWKVFGARSSEALAALGGNAALRGGLGDEVVDWFVRLKASEVSRHEAAADKTEWDRREYFGRL